MRKLLFVRELPIYLIKDLFNFFAKQSLMQYLDASEVSSYWNKKAKFIYVSPINDRTSLSHISSYFYTAGVLDLIIIGSNDKNIGIYSYNPFQKLPFKRFFEMDNQTTGAGFYPDKLKDLNGFYYKIIFFNQYPMIFNSNLLKTYTGIGYHFMETVAKKQNASVAYRQMKTSNRDLVNQQIKRLFNSRQVDLLLNTGLFEQSNANAIAYVNTFETDGFCAILPYPKRKSFLSYFIEPFDLWTWIVIMAITSVFVVIWHYLNKKSKSQNPNSAGYILFAIVAFFMGQGVKFHENRLIQKIMIQLMIMMTFILGNAYQSVLTSIMSDSRYGSQVTTIQGILNENVTLTADPMFLDMMKSSDQLQALNQKIIGSFSHLIKLNFEKLASENTGVIINRNILDLMYMDTKGTFKIPSNAIDFYYRVPEKFYSFYLRFPTIPFSMFNDRLQKFSTRIHESGVKQHWQALLNFEESSEIRKWKFNAEEEYLLNLADMAGSFYCLVFGFAFSLAAFILEIFYGDFLRHLNWTAFKPWMRRKFRRLVNRNKVNHRIIQVQPRV